MRISGINWYGFETTDEVVHGLSNQDYKVILSTMYNMGYNTVRLPYSNQMVESPVIPSSIGYANSSGPINSELKGQNSLQIMDKVIAEAGTLGLKVILDNHRSEAGNSAEFNGLWYTSAYSETSWIADWKMLVARYSGYVDASGNPTLIGGDLRNEPHFYNGAGNGACWTGDSKAGGCPTGNAAQNWPAAATRAANAILAINPNLLIFVEGVDCYSGDCAFWGENLEGVKSYPLQLNVPHRIIYSAHDYGPAEYDQIWFNSTTSNQSLDAVWTKFWAYICVDGIAPVWVGEFGTTNDAASAESSVPGSEGQWFSSLVSFLGNQPLIHWSYWALNGEDHYGLLDATYDAIPASSLKQQLLSSIQSKLSSAPPGCGVLPATPLSPVAKAISSSSIGLSWSAVVVPAKCSVTYSVYRGASAQFAVSSATLIASGVTAPNYSDAALQPSTTYYYAVEATDAVGDSTASAKASASTLAASVCGAVPSNPGGLAALPLSSTSIALNWKTVPAPANCSVSYSVFRSSANDFAPSSRNQIVAGLSGSSFADTALAASTNYFYVVKAVDGKGASGASPEASATTAKPSIGAECRVVYTIVSQWTNGFQAAIAVTNTSSTALHGWKLAFAFPGSQQVTTLWNASYLQVGQAITLTDEGYNWSIAAGATYNALGLVATYTGINYSPANFSLNGSICTVP
ncbi:Endo-1,4-beta-xylanase A precursor [Acidisarcina polymorpha]|uniref:cellulase n=1 Tax=Acidisarcina polymorpha TaxID=2211140 RepID=A0A2Z5G189_9BACT|nr:Endo-1,4-beta-xylanase A precursor [Acidisarcina polymorpha]